jgi:riboflavin kinase / FMN adenylyltransferase
MKVIRWDLLESVETKKLIESLCLGHKGTAMTIGGFDGPHLGHESLFSAVLEASQRMNLASGIVTFVRSPGVAKRPFQYPGDVSTLNLRLSRFEQKGFDFVLLIDFSADFGRIVGGVFFDILVKTVCMRYLAVGPDFRCGHRLDTGTAEISAFSRRDGFRFDSIQQVDLEGRRISSSSVRLAVQNADFPLAERLLGHPFLLDFTAPVWIATDKNTFVASCNSFTQILPRRGRYQIVLHTTTGKSVSAELNVTGNQVFVLPVDSGLLPESSAITTIEFRLS